MNYKTKSSQSPKEDLLDLLAIHAYKFGQFTLSSGRESTHYVNCKPVSLSGKGLHLISDLMLQFVEPDSVAVAGLTLGADPLVSGVSMRAWQNSRDLSALIVRKKPKGHGTESLLEGALPEKGALITVLEDVVTTGGSSIQAVNHLREAGYVVNKVITVVDREEGGRSLMNNLGLQLESICLLSEIYLRAESLSNEK